MAVKKSACGDKEENYDVDAVVAAVVVGDVVGDVVIVGGVVDYGGTACIGRTSPDCQPKQRSFDPRSPQIPAPRTCSSNSARRVQTHDEGQQAQSPGSWAVQSCLCGLRGLLPRRSASMYPPGIRLAGAGDEPAGSVRRGTGRSPRPDGDTSEVPGSAQCYGNSSDLARP